MAERRDDGRAALARLLAPVGAGGAGAFPRVPGWPLDGFEHRAWSDSLPAADGAWTLRVQLRTDVLSGFTGTPAQLAVLERVRPALAALVRDSGQPDRLELASCVVARSGDRGRGADVLWLAARAHAAEAEALRASAEVTASGLQPAPGASEPPPAPAPPGPASGWTTVDLGAVASVLPSGAGARAVLDATGLSARLSLGPTEPPHGLIDVRTGVVHPRLGAGLSVVLATGLGGSVLDALALNARDLSAAPGEDVLGSWQSTPAGLVHVAFYPDALRSRLSVASILLDAERRAREIVLRPGDPPARRD